MHRMTSDAQNSRRLLRLSLPIVVVSCLWLGTAASARAAIDEFSYDRDLARALTEMRSPPMRDYAEIQITNMLRLYPDADKQEAALLERARLFFYLSGEEKIAQAEQLLSTKIRADGPNARAAVLLRAEMFGKRGEFDRADKVYAEFFKKYPAAGPAKHEQAEYEEAIQQHVAVLQRIGDPDRVAELFSRSKATPSDLAERRRFDIERVSAILSAAEKARELGKPVNLETIRKAKTAAAAVVNWAGQSDPNTTAGIIELAHACILLGEFDEAIKTLNSGAALIKLFDDMMKDINKKAQAREKDPDTGATYAPIEIDIYSPKPAALYYMALAQSGKAKALQKTKPAVAEALVKDPKSGALLMLKAIQTRYPGSPFAMRASMAASRLRREYGVLGAAAQQDATAELLSKMTEAKPYVEARKWPEARKILLEAIRVGRGSPRTPEAIDQLLDSTLDPKSPAPLLGEALGAFLADAYPNYSTPDDNAVGILGRYITKLQQGAKEIKDPAVRDARQEVIMGLVLRLGELPCPKPEDRRKVAQKAFELAEIKYGRAAALDAEARGAATDAQQAGPEAEKKRKEARVLFLAAAPFYQRVIDRFPEQPKAPASYFKLGWIYYTIADAQTPDAYMKAASMFDKYVQTEVDLEGQCENRVQAMFRAAESFMLGGAPAEAITRLPVLQKELDSPITKRMMDGLKAKGDPASLKRLEAFLFFREKATAYAGWSYNLWAAQLRDEMKQLDNRMIDLQQSIMDAEREAQRQGSAATAKDSELKQATADYDEALAALSGMPGAADAERKAAEWRALNKEEATIRQMVAEFQETSCRDWLIRLDGEKTVRGEQMASFRQEGFLAADRLEKAEKDLARLRADAATQEQTVTARQEQAAAIQKRMDTAETACQTAKTAYDEFSQKLDAVKKEQAATNKVAAAKRWQELQAERERLAPLKIAAEDAAKKAEKARAAVATPELQKQQQDARNGQAKAQALLEELKAETPKAEEEVAMRKRDAGLAAARAAAAKASVERGTLAMTLAGGKKVATGMALKTAQAVLANPKYQAAVQAELAAQKKVADMQTALIVQRRELAGRNLGAADAKIAQLKEDLKTTEAERAPRLQTIDEKRRQAETLLRGYLRDYPNGKLASDALARLGDILFELKRDDEAAGVLGELMQKFPESKAAKTAAFSAGRAYANTGQFAKASEQFAVALKKVNDLGVPNLKYIAETMQASGPQVAYAAAVEILKRGANPKDAEYASAGRKTLREPMMVLAARAALGMGNLDEALRQLQVLEVENANTAQYYALRFVRAQALLKKTPPDSAKALEAFLQILNAQHDPVTECRARMEIAAVNKSANEQQKALGQYQRVMLIDPALLKEAVALWETAAAEGAAICAASGDADGLQKIVADYRAAFPKGAKLRALEAMKPGAPAAGTKPGR